MKYFKNVKMDNVEIVQISWVQSQDQNLTILKQRHRK